MTWFEASRTSEAVVTAQRSAVWAALVDPDAIASMTPLVERIEADAIAGTGSCRPFRGWASAWRRRSPRGWRPTTRTGSSSSTTRRRVGTSVQAWTVSTT